jgi:cell wall-associated NlpC family hydrolase
MANRVATMLLAAALGLTVAPDVATATTAAGAVTGGSATPLATPRVHVGSAYTTAPEVHLGWHAATQAARFEVTYRSAGYRQAFGPVHRPARLRSTSQTSVSLSVQPGHTYCFTVRAHLAADTSPWSPPRCVSTAIPAHLVSSKQGKTVSWPRTRLDHLAIDAQRCPTCGRVKALVNGTSLGVVDLMSQTTGPAVVAFPGSSYVDGRLTLQVLSRGRPVAVTAAIPARSRIPADAWVAVSVASIWSSPQAPRAVDAPALTRPARPDLWTRRLTADLRFGLHGRLETQVLLGSYVRVVSTRGRWSRVEIPDQVGSVFPGGILAWVPSRQLTRRPLPATRRVATVTSRLASSFRSRRARRTAALLSYGTTLPVISSGRRWTRVAWPGGGSRWLHSRAVVRHAADTSALHGGGRSAVSQARRFRGLGFLWAGRSAFGYDCAGLIAAVYRQFGIALAADAADQAAQGRPVARSHLRPGDVIFFSLDGSRAGIHHAAMYAGGGRIVESPHTGSQVHEIKLWQSPSLAEYWGARRYL